MPAYKNSKAVDLKKIKGQAEDEQAYQQEYARKAKARDSLSYAKTGRGTLTRRGNQTMERVAAGGQSREYSPPKKAKKSKQSTMGAAEELYSKVSALAQAAKDRLKKFQDLGNK